MRRIPAVIACAWLVFGSAALARASAILTVTEDVSGVVVSGTGSINLSAFTFFTDGSQFASLIPTTPSALAGPAGLGAIDAYGGGGLSGPSNFGPGPGSLSPSAGSGAKFGINRSIQVPGGFFITVPDGYVSNGPLSASGAYG